MTTFEIYNKLSNTEKAKLLWAKGVYLSEREDRGIITQLYGLFDFYVEVFYNETGNDIIDIQCFNQIENLDPYLTHIDIKPLLSNAA